MGRAGEDHAGQLYERTGWSIQGRNVRDGPREIDLVARRGREIAFVEVKTRRHVGPGGHPLEAVGWRKRRDVERAARAWLRTRGQPGDHARFDVVVVWMPDRGPVRTEWFQDAWRVRGS